MPTEPGASLLARLHELAAFSDEPGRLTRLYLSPSHIAAAHRVRAWMEQAGMCAAIDAVGNVVGRYEGREPHHPALLLGSHIDTVRDAGAYDGNLGVLAAIAAVAALHEAGALLAHPVEVIAFGDEEGVRFPTTLIGSRAVAGTLDPRVFEARDAEGISVRQALPAIGGDADRFRRCARRPEQVACYLELHIEQGPVLEETGLALGIVSAIAGASRAAVRVEGTAGHAGTVPMRLRRDALAAAAEMVLAAERIALATPDLVATVGRLEALPGAVNVIPGVACLSLDVRSPRDAVRAAAIAALRQAFATIAARRGCRLGWETLHDAPAVLCHPTVVAALEATLTRLGQTVRHLPSGAGHDAMAMAALCPSGMLFLRCRGGISHHPAESISAADAGLGVRALIEAMHQLDRILWSDHVRSD